MWLFMDKDKEKYSILLIFEAKLTDCHYEV